MVAAAAEHQDQRQDDDPGTAIVKDMAEAVVVIHKQKILPIAEEGRTLPPLGDTFLRILPGRALKSPLLQEILPTLWRIFARKDR